MELSAIATTQEALKVYRILVVYVVSMIVIKLLKIVTTQVISLVNWNLVVSVGQMLLMLSSKIATIREMLQEQIRKLAASSVKIVVY